ncbi:MAG: TSUP family transporter [Phycisphaera sp.]|nr:TSUP family transporter [Phycisphaera sp.]
MFFPTIPAHIPAWWYFVCIGAAVLVIGIAKAGFGGGIGILAVPLMSLAVGPRQMLGMMLPLLIACDILANLHHLGHYEWRLLKWLLPGAVIGVGTGTLVLVHLRGESPESFNFFMTVMVGSICLAVVLLQAYRLTGREVPTLPSHPASSVVVGTVAGTASTLNHSAGPIITVYLLQEKLNKQRFVSTQLFYFLLINTAKLPTFLLLPMTDDGRPLINAQTLHDSIWFIPLIPVGTLMGIWLHKRVPEKPFAATLYVVAGLAAGDMLLKAFTGFSIFNLGWLVSH